MDDLIAALDEDVLKIFEQTELDRDWIPYIGMDESFARVTDSYHVVLPWDETRVVVLDVADGQWRIKVKPIISDDQP